MRSGSALALVTGVVDQASKLWLLYGFDLESRGRVAITPFVDLVVTWNTGISYGLFQQQGLVGVWALLAFKVVAVVVPLDLAGAGVVAADRRWRSASSSAGRSATPSTGCTGRA